jgi:hypothetical protein
MFMGVYFTWAVMTVMSSRVYLNLVLVDQGGGRHGMTTAGLSSFHTRRANHPEGTEREAGHIETSGAKKIHRRIPLTTFSTVSLYLFSSLHSTSLTLHTLFRRSSAWNVKHNRMPNRTLRSKGAKTLSGTLAPDAKIFYL